jgi:tetratricopeptide (TPR) repeat protein
MSLPAKRSLAPVGPERAAVFGKTERRIQVVSTLTFTKYEMPSASLGRLNPLPDLRKTADLHTSVEVDEETVTPEEARYMGWARVNGILPYLIQDGYNRKKKMRAWKAAVLENDYIRATFLPELGGRLWSLIDKTKGRELLHKNPVFQPCNLALRNAWISGGVEWNIGIIGHTPFTVDRMFTEDLKLSDGTPVLRMYQYERIRRLIFRIEAMLPADSRYLYVRVRIDNAVKKDTAVYWWSNIAVDEREDVRVLVPAERSFRWGYGKKMSKVPIPYMPVQSSMEGRADEKSGQQYRDISRTTQLPQAMDFFFDLPRGQRPWISAVGGDGYGLIQTSTDLLRGRKLFVWGMGAGGRNWQAFLAQPGFAYLEIQAGLARTQLEHLPMKTGAVLSWMEAYGPIAANADVVQGKDWLRAVEAIEEALEVECPRSKVEKMHLMASRELDGQSGRIRTTGAGWALVQKELLGDDFTDGGLRFPARSLGRREGQWIQLIRHGALPCPGVLEEPGSYQIEDEWERLLANSIRSGGSRHWYGYYQFGVILAYKGRLNEAKAAFDKSILCEVNPWALRCKAVLLEMEGNIEKAADLYVQAVTMLPQRSIAKEALRVLLKAGRAREVIHLYDMLPSGVRALGRIKVLLIEALLDAGDISRAERMLGRKIELTDIREGEVKLTDLWFRMEAMKRMQTCRAAETYEEVLKQVKEECIPPAHLDFRMH